MTDTDQLTTACFQDLVGARAFVMDHVQGHYSHRVWVSAYEPTLRRIQFHRDVNHESLDGIGHRTKYYLENDTDFMDQPGEWVFSMNSGAAVLYLLTGNGGTYGIDLAPSSLDRVEIAKRFIGFNLSGRSGITLDGLVLHYIQKDEQEFYGNGNQGAVVVINDDAASSSNLVLRNLEIIHDCMGFWLTQDTDQGRRIEHTTVDECYIHDMDQTGFYLSQ